MKHNKEKKEEQLNGDAQQENVDKQAQAAKEAVEAPEQPDYQQELAKQKDAYLRLYAEFDNYKKRTARDKADWIKFASSDVLEALLPVLDDFERGLAAQAKEHPGSADTEGFTLIYQKLSETLKQKGLVAIDVKAGDDFNVDIHDAIARIPAPQEKLKGKIVDVTQKGYKLGDHVIRYAKVVMGE